MSWTLAFTYWGYEFDAWSILGFVGGLVFATRFVIQWLASELKGQSTIPISFWWISIAGSSMLLVYFQHRGDPVGVAGNSLNTLIYVRNLQLIGRRKREAASSLSNPGEPEDC